MESQVFFTFSYKPGATKSQNCQKMIGKEMIKEAKNETLSAVKNGSCKAVKITLDSGGRTSFSGSNIQAKSGCQKVKQTKNITKSVPTETARRFLSSTK